MTQAKWESIKARAVTLAKAGSFGATGYAFPAEVILDAIAERRSLDESREALAELIRRRVLAWDIRAAGTLRDLFPRAFPAPFRSGPIVADMDDSGDWILVR